MLLPKYREITETTASVNLQELLNSTARSILEVTCLEFKTPVRATLVCKWGFDGSAGHSTYKIPFSDPNRTDEFLFLIALCPLKLVNDDTGRAIWNNPHPSSTFYCQ